MTLKNHLYPVKDPVCQLTSHKQLSEHQKLHQNFDVYRCPHFRKLKRIVLDVCGRLTFNTFTELAIVISLKHPRKNVTSDLHLTYSKNGGNLGLVLIQ